MTTDEEPGRQLLQCTVRIDTEIKGGRVGGGTGFITSYNHDNKVGNFLVTNRHVVADATRIKLEFLTKSDGKKPHVAKKIALGTSDPSRAFVFHNDPNVDIAVMPFTPIGEKYFKEGTPLRYRTIPSDIYLTRSQSKTIPAIEEIVVIGYPRLLRDEQTLTPIARKGITATPVDQDFHGFRGFLIDAAIFEGSSGSPVFIYNVGSYSTPNGIVMGGRLIFLGVLTRLVSEGRSFPWVSRENAGSSPVLDGEPNSTDAAVPMSKYTNLGLVFNAECVHEAIAHTIEVYDKHYSGH